MTKHWTEAQEWRNKETQETVPAKTLLERYGRFLRVNHVSLCCSNFDVRMDDGSKWTRILTR